MQKLNNNKIINYQLFFNKINFHKCHFESKLINKQLIITDN